MSDAIGHECGLAMVRLRHPLSYYAQRHGDAAWGMRKLFLLMEKQHNRGQDGAGIGVVKFDMPPGDPFLLRERSTKRNAVERIFDTVTSDLGQLTKLGPDAHEIEIKRRCQYLGESYIGHLRYGTYAGNRRAMCHPYVRKNIVASRCLAMAGNFNMTNSSELFAKLVEYGLNPVGDSDTQVIIEKIGYFLDREHEILAAAMGPGSLRNLEDRQLADEISREINLVRVLEKASEHWDGGYVFGGLLGNGDSFVCRDPNGIRPAFYYMDDEVFAVASERPALSNVFNAPPDDIKPVPRGHILVMKHDGRLINEPFTTPREPRFCTFERVYFSRGNDPDIYQERKRLGANLADRVYEALDGDLAHAVFSYIPNTSETAYLGLCEALDDKARQQKARELWQRIERGDIHETDLAVMLNGAAGGLIRREKIAHKDQRLRTFITHDKARRDLVAHVYDITRGAVRDDDTLVVVDDSIVRGTTLRESIITMLSRLEPKRIIVVSSAPPIMYPDCYGIDMSQLERFIAFEAAVSLLRDRGEESLLEEVEALCAEQEHGPADRMRNHVRMIYDRFSLDEISERIAKLVRPTDIRWQGEISVIYQTVDGLRRAMPGHTGDWYFTGDYPTPGGFAVLNRSYLNWRRLIQARAY